MKINLYKTYLTKIIVPVITVYKNPAAIFSYNFFVCCNNTLTATETNHTYTNDAKQCDASFSFLPPIALCIVESLPANKNINNKNFTKTKTLRIFASNLHIEGANNFSHHL
jgi:hypothetical protein